MKNKYLHQTKHVIWVVTFQISFRLVVKSIEQLTSWYNTIMLERSKLGV